jgi:hypothetical protein
MMPSPPRIGIDFDNTIISYDAVFRAAAKRIGLLANESIINESIGCKRAVRDAVRLLPDGELTWQRLQGHVYGKGIAGATLMPGFNVFLRRCKIEGCAVSIVSHKTEFGHYDPDRVNLRKAALDWMAAQGLFDSIHAIAPKDVYFESTRAEKLARIEALSLSLFVDDLDEVLTDPGFPAPVRRILFGEAEQRPNAPYLVCRTWHEVEHLVFDGDRR